MYRYYVTYIDELGVTNSETWSFNTLIDETGRGDVQILEVYDTYEKKVIPWEV